MRAALLARALLALALLAGCGDGRAGGAPAAAEPIPDSVFVRLVAELSEPDRYFDTDNLISNESSYLHVVDELERRELRGGAYLGVGPGQNFSYMVAIRPTLAFLVDIRRDNLLQHLWYRALFELSDSRLDYLCLLTSRSCGGPSGALDLQALVGRVDAASPVDSLDAVVRRVVEAAGATGLPLSQDDSAYIGSIHRRFAAAGLDLRFNTHGRTPRPDYPTLRRLLLERDGAGRQAGYLATEEGFAWLATLQRSNRVVPIVGDLAGDHALRAVGRELERRRLRLAAFYVSNVEFYLFGDGRFDDFIANLQALPTAADAVVIRSYFNRFRTLPQTVPGYSSTQLLQTIPALLAGWEEGRFRRYGELVLESGS